MAQQRLTSREGSGEIIRRTGSVTIADEESLSDAFNSLLGKIVNIVLPEIVSAAITFKVSLDGTTFVDLYDETGAEVEYPASTGEQAFPVPELAGYEAFKVRSGTSASPVNQTSGPVTIGVSVSD